MGCCASAERDDDPQTSQNRQAPYSSPGNATSSTRVIIPRQSGQTQNTTTASASTTSPDEQPAGNNSLFAFRGHGLGHGLGHGQHDRGHKRAPSGQVNKPLRLHHQWSSPEPLSRKELERRRIEFFDTRVTGRQETWNAIRMAIETMQVDLSTAQTILDAAGVTLPAGDLVRGAYDELGNLYLVPEYCLSDPFNLVTDEEMRALGGGRHDRNSSLDETNDKGEEAVGEGDKDEDLDVSSPSRIRRREEKGKSIAGELFKIRVRLSDRGGKDLEILIGKEESVRVIVRRMCDDALVGEAVKIRLALLGKMLKDSETLHAQGWRPGLVINAFVFHRLSPSASSSPLTS